jgi:GNAT superfamily N-acetyltransferase
MEIRLVRTDEHERLGEVTVAAYAAINPAEFDDDLLDYQIELRDVAGRAAGADVLVAVDGEGTVLGGVTYVGDPSSPSAEFDEPDAAGIRMLAVVPEAQGQGVGEALARACIDRALSRGRAQIVLHSTHWMTAAHRLYQRLGFRPDPAYDREIAPGFTLLGFRLRLDDNPPTAPPG